MAGLSLLPEAFLGWHQIQESLSRLTGLEFALYGEDGEPLGMVSGESPFCRSIRRGGLDGSFCSEQCGRFIKESAGKDSVQHFKCLSGQGAFALPISQGGSRLVVSGGKTFGGRDDYKKALDLLKKTGGKVSVTGRHRYRYIGKRRLGEVLSLVTSAAIQHFGTSYQKYSYQLKHNRQAALLENVSLLYQEKGRPELIEGLLRTVTTLFEAESASLQLYGTDKGSPDAHYTYGQCGEAARSALTVPFPGGGDGAAGMLTLFNSGLQGEDLTTLKAYVQQTASILENNRLNAEAKDNIEKLGKLMSLGSHMGELLDPDEIFRFILDRSAELLAAERGSLMLLNERTEELIIKVSKGFAPDHAGRRPRSGEGIAGKVIAAGAAIRVEDMENDERLSQKKRPEYKTKSFISLPLKAEGRVIGVINLADKESGGVFSQEDLELVSGVASQASMAIERAIYYGRAEDLKRLHIKDPLTGLLNRRYFGERFLEELDRSRRYGHSLTLLVAAIERFDAYRRESGPASADEAITKVGGIIRSALRANDIVARYGDSSFAVALPETGRGPASALADRLAALVAEAAFAGPAGRAGLTLKVGIAGWPEDGPDMEALVSKACMGALEEGAQT